MDYFYFASLEPQVSIHCHFMEQNSLSILLDFFFGDPHKTQIHKDLEQHEYVMTELLVLDDLSLPQ